MPYLPPAPKSAAPPPPPEPPRKERRFRVKVSGAACVRVAGWLVVTALAVFSAIVVLTWNQNKDARSASLRVASIEAPVANALSLKAGPADPTVPVEAVPAVPEPVEEPVAAEKADSPIVPAPPPAPEPVVGMPEILASKDWPRSVALKGTPEVKIVSEDAKNDEYVYHTEHFEFCCDAPVGPDAVRHFARVFEATWLLNCMIPLDLRPAPETMRKWFRARILSTDEAYMATGAPAGSGGYYSRADKTIYVPISSLGMKLVGQKRVMLDQSVESNDTLIHEITHQMMSRWLPKLPVWFTEGSAEYNGITDFVHGRFFLSAMESRLKAHLRARIGQKNAGPVRFQMLRVAELLAMDNRTWASGLDGSAGTENYASALLMTYYLYHLDRDRDTSGVIAWLRDIESGRSTDESFRERVLGKRNVAQLEAELLHAYRQIGIELEFTRRGGQEFK